MQQLTAITGVAELGEQGKAVSSNEVITTPSSSNTMETFNIVSGNSLNN